MREEDFEPDDDREDRRSSGPAFPIVVKIAGLIWIGFGVLELIGAVIALSQAGGNPGGGGVQPTGALCPGLIGIAFFVCGYQTVTGKAKDTLGNGIGSILLGILQIIVGVGTGFLGANLNNPIKDGTLVLVVAAVLGALGTSLITAGALALYGRTAYREWAQSQKKPRRRRRDDNDDDDDRPRRRRDDNDDDDDRPRRRRRKDDDDLS